MGITKKREPKLEMLNAYFNLYTDKTGKNRPLLISKSLRGVVQKRTKQGVFNDPYVVVNDPKPNRNKGVFKPLPDSNFATVTVSFGRVEVLGVKSFDVLRKIYKMMTTIYASLPDETTQTYLLTNNRGSRTKRST